MRPERSHASHFTGGAGPARCLFCLLKIQSKIEMKNRGTRNRGAVLVWPGASCNHSNIFLYLPGED